MSVYERVLSSRSVVALARSFQVEWMTLERASEGRLPESLYWFVGITLAVSPEDRAGASSLLASAGTWDGLSQPQRPLLDAMVQLDPEGSRAAVQGLARLADIVQGLRQLFTDSSPKTQQLRQPVCGGGPPLTGLAAALLGAGDVLVDHDHGSPVCVDPDHPAASYVLDSYPNYYAGRAAYSAVPAQILDEVVGWHLPHAPTGSGHDAATDFWSFVDECQRSAGLHVEKIEGAPVVRCLKVYYAVHDVYGDRGALLAYVTRLLPVLYGLSPSLVKTEREFVALLKAGTDAPMTTSKPGRARTADGDYDLLSERPEHYVARPAGGGRAFLLPKRAENSSFVVMTPPPVAQLLDADLHGVARFNRRPEQRALVHGADPSQWQTTDPSHAFGGYGRWVKVANGSLAYLKPGLVREAEQEATYHNLAHDFFGLGAHVPATAVFDDPSTGERKSLSAVVPNAEHAWEGHLPHHFKILHGLATTGDLDRLALMDGLMGHDDRDNRRNYVFSVGNLHLIDNGAFEPYAASPHYWTSYHGADGMKLPIHPAAAEWAKALDPQEFQRQLESHGTDAGVVEERTASLRDLQAALAHRGPSLTRGEAWSAMQGGGLGKSELTKMARKVPPAPDTKLVALHGLSPEALLHAHKYGGFAAPSIGVSSADQPMDRYGDITLVGDPELGDPVKNPVFDADVYSPRHPKTVYKVPDKVWNKFQRQLSPHFDVLGYGTDQLRDKLEDGGVEAATEDSRTRRALGLAYLKEMHGVDVPVPTKKRKTDPEWLDTPPIHDYFAKNPDLGHNSYRWDGPHTEPLGQAVAAGIRHFWNNVSGLDPEDRADMVDASMSQYFNDGKLHFGGALKVIGGYRAMGAVIPDRYAHDEAIDRALEPHSEHFRQWAHAKMGGLLEGPFIRKVPADPFRWDGTRKPVRHVPYSLDEVLKVMKRRIRSGEGFNYGAGSTRSLGARRFKSVDEMRRHAGRLVDRETMDSHKIAFNAKLTDLAEKLAPYHEGGGRMSAMLEALGESFKRGRNLHRELQESGYQNVPRELVTELAGLGRELISMPTEYFEAKPQRVVRLNEFRGAAVPHDVHPSVIEALNHHGIHVETYQRGDVESRRRAVRRAAELRGLFLAEVAASDLHKN